MIVWLWCILAAYLIGSIPVGVLIGRAKGVNIRQHGSKNIGATNVGRVLGKKFGVLCFVLDFLKGVAPVAGAGVVNHVFGRSAEELTSTQMWLWMAVAAAAVLGHMYSMWLRFAGGKGVATGFGAIIAMFNVLTLPALGAVVVWYVALRLSKYVSLASILAVLTIPMSYLLSVVPPHATNQPLATTLKEVWHASPPLFGTLAIALLVVWRHRANIGRLRRGEEPKVGGKAHRGSVTEMTGVE